MASAFVTMVTLMTSLTMAVTAQSNYGMQAIRASGLVWLDTEWAVAFRLAAGAQTSAYAHYRSTGSDDDHPLPRAFMPPSCFQSPFHCCPYHYHSALLNLWPSQYINQVRLSLIEGGRERAHVLFNGTGSTVTSWFSRSRVLSSSWTDLTTQPQNYFTIEGHHKPTPASYTYSRKFYIFRNYGGCPADSGWLSVQDQNIDVCAWGTLNASHPFPAIMYSKRSTFVTFNTADVGMADSMLITVNFLPLNSPCSP
ncbi:hypothetical protein ACOMHN_034436 [Nucella lapillus]